MYQRSWRTALLCGWAFGAGFFASLLYWIAIFGTLPLVGLAIFQGAFTAVFAVAGRLIGGRLGLWCRLILLPMLWISLEWFRSLGLLGFTWGNIGYSQYKVLPVIQIAEITGVLGVSFIIALANAALANMLISLKAKDKRSPAFLQMSAAALVILASSLFGVTRISAPITPSGAKITAAVVQGNVRQDTDDWFDFAQKTWDIYRPLTVEAARNGADLIVWPETAVPGNLAHDPGVQRQLFALSRLTKVNLLVGGWKEYQGKAFNSAFLINPKDGIVSEYSKTHLVPFGEFVPARKYMPFLQYYRVRPQDTSPGTGYNIMRNNGYRIGTAICFESAFPYISRKLTSAGAELLCVITDDEWFGNTSAAEQHLSKSVFRAVENRRYLLRGAATGVSAVIDPKGSILDSAPLWKSSVIVHDVWPVSGKTFYTRHGDWLVLSSLAGILVFLLLPILGYLYNRRTGQKSRS